jgi:hypothetical protein
VTVFPWKNGAWPYAKPDTNQITKEIAHIVLFNILISRISLTMIMPSRFSPMEARRKKKHTQSHHPKRQLAIDSQRELRLL